LKQNEKNCCQELLKRKTAHKRQNYKKKREENSERKPKVGRKKNGRDARKNVMKMMMKMREISWDFFCFLFVFHFIVDVGEY